jgi:hypothetical protein
LDRCRVHFFRIEVAVRGPQRETETPDLAVAVAVEGDLDETPDFRAGDQDVALEGGNAAAWC